MLFLLATPSSEHAEDGARVPARAKHWKDARPLGVGLSPPPATSREEHLRSGAIPRIYNCTQCEAVQTMLSGA